MTTLMKSRIKNKFSEIYKGQANISELAKKNIDRDTYLKD